MRMRIQGPNVNTGASPRSTTPQHERARPRRHDTFSCSSSPPPPMPLPTRRCEQVSSLARTRPSLTSTVLHHGPRYKSLSLWIQPPACPFLDPPSESVIWSPSTSRGQPTRWRSPLAKPTPRPRHGMHRSGPREVRQNESLYRDSKLTLLRSEGQQQPLLALLTVAVP